MLGAGVWLLLTFSAAAFGARFGPDEWYRQLAKPIWTPPNAIFAPVWTILYLLMATAAWLVWKRHGVDREPVVGAQVIGSPRRLIAFFPGSDQLGRADGPIQAHAALQCGT
jgi:TspO/MBR family